MVSLEDMPRFSVIETDCTQDISWITVMAHGARFQISLALEDIKSTEIEQQYLPLAERLETGDDEPDDQVDLQDLLLKPCSSLIKELAPEKPENITLQQYYFPPTYFFKLITKDDALIALMIDESDSSVENSMMMPMSKLPDHPGIPLRRASTIRILPADSKDDTTCEFPERVQESCGTARFFKPALFSDQIVREIETQVKILQAHLSSLRIPKLHAIITDDEVEMVLGLMFDLIPSNAWHLGDDQFIQAKEHHAKWRSQMFELVAELHKHDIVWGDVHPGNIMIDHDFNAWAVDFGGGWVERFVRRKEAETKEGDWKGL